MFDLLSPLVGQRHTEKVVLSFCSRTMKQYLKSVSMFGLFLTPGNCKHVNNVKKRPNNRLNEEVLKNAGRKQHYLEQTLKLNGLTASLMCFFKGNSWKVISVSLTVPVMPIIWKQRTLHCFAIQR